MTSTQVNTLREEWLSDVNGLVDQVTAWSEETSWTVQRTEGEATEEEFGTYPVPVLTIETPFGRLIMEPQAVNAGGKGRVKLYAASTLYRVRLLRGDSDGEWKILTDSGIALRQPWTQETFVRLAEDLLGAS